MAAATTTTVRAGVGKDVGIPRTRSKSRLAISAALNQISTTAGAPSGTGPPKDPWDPQRELPTRGLFNNGNTCFFNAALQNVFKTRLLHHALFADPERRKGNFIGPMNKALRRVMLEMLGDGKAPERQGKSGGKQGATERSYDPRALLVGVQRAHPMFKGKSQQDAHELFLHLLSTLEDEENSYMRRRLEEARDGGNTEKPDRKRGKGVKSGGGGDDDGDGDVGSSDSEEGDGGVSISSVGDGDVAEAKVEGNKGDSSSSGETSTDPTMPGESTSSEQSGNGCNETASTVSNTTQAREQSDEAAAWDVDTAVVSATDGPIVEDPSCRPDGPWGKGDGVLDSAGRDGSVRSADAADLADAGRGCTIKVIATTPSTAGMTRSSQVNDASSSVNPAAGSGNLSTQYSAPLSPKEKSKRELLVEPAIAASSASPRQSEALGIHEDELAGCEGETNNSAVSKHKASRAATGSVATAACTDVATQGEEMLVAAGAAASSRSVRTEYSASRRDIGDVETDDEGATTDEGDQNDYGSGAEGVPTAAAAPASVSAATDCPPPSADAPAKNLPARASNRAQDEEKHHEEQEAEKEGVECVKRENTMPSEKVEPGARTAPIPRGSAVIEVFGGSLCSVVTCGSCCARSFSTEPTVCLSLEIPMQKKGASSTIASRKAAIEAKEAETNHKTSGGRHGLADYELSAKEKRKRARQERERTKKESLEATELESRNKANGGGKKPDGGASENTEVSSIPVATPAEDGGSTLPQVASTKDQEEIRKCLSCIIQQICETVSAEDIGVMGLSDESKLLRAGAVTGAEATPTADNVCDSGGGVDTSNARLDVDAHGVAANRNTTVRLDNTVEGAVEPEDRNTSISNQHQDQMTSGVGERSCRARQGDSSLTRPTGGPHANDGSVGGNEMQGGKATGVRDRSSGHRIEMTSVPTETAQRDSWSARAALGVSGCASAQSLTGCTTGTENTASVGDSPSHRSAFGTECSDGTDDYTVGEIQEKESGGAKAAVEAGTAVSDADRLTSAAAAAAAAATDASSDAASSPNAKHANAQSLPTTSCGAGNTGQTEDADRNDATKNTTAEEDSGQGGKQESAAATAFPSTETIKGAAPTPLPPPPPPPSNENESPLNDLVEPPMRRQSDPKSRLSGGSAGIDLYACFDHFMAEEELVAAEGNGYDCEKCRARTADEQAARPPAAVAGVEAKAAVGAGATEEQTSAETDGALAEEEALRNKHDARKRMLMLGEPPGVLVCHLKRLQARSKVRKHVDFPVDLDMAPYFWQDPKAPLSLTATRYRLFGILVHTGNRSGGHYVAFVREGDVWKHASDTKVRESSLLELKKCEAYMLFYERCDKDPASAPSSSFSAKETAAAASVAQDTK